jgi:hypothetical protein
MAGKMTSEGIARAAALIGVGVPEMRAVIAVETNGDGFLPDGRPKILFERHKFHSFTGGKFDAVAPRVSNAKAGGYESATSEYTRLYIAMQLDADAAIMSASWGVGQLMGFNWKLCGERSLMGFVLAMHHNEDVQLALTAQFIKSVGADDELRRHDWAGFAKIYNGPAYARNKYDEKLAAAYKRYS